MKSEKNGISNTFGPHLRSRRTTSPQPPAYIIADNNKHHRETDSSDLKNGEKIKLPI
jgi:hypothetical protein